MVSRVLSAMMGAVPLVQENLRKEPLAEQVRTTVLLNSSVSDMSVLMVTSDTGSAGRIKLNGKMNHSSSSSLLLLA